MKESKTILIIGAKSDIGMAAANKFGSKGFDIQLAARNSRGLITAAKDLGIKYGVRADVLELDILQYDSFTSFISLLNPLPDIVLSTIGILGNQKEDEKSILNSSLIFMTNYEGPALLINELANHFELRRRGSIIGCSSVAGDRGRGSNYIYGSAKAGFSSFLSGLRNRLYQSNVNVLTISPGFVNTKMTEHLDLPKFLTSNPKKIANLIYKNRKKNKVLYPFPWGIIMTLIKLVPNFVYNRLKF